MAQMPAGFVPDGFVPDQVAAPSANEQKQRQSTNTALALGGSAAAVPAAKQLIEEIATNPQVYKGGRAAGEVLGGIGGLIKGGPVGAAIGMASGEKAGGVLANAAQRLAVPVASAIDKAAPYVQTLSSMSGIQGGLDLAQIAEPTRQDIGILGIGKTQHVPGQQPAMLNAMVNYLMKQGLSKVQALEALLVAKSGAR